jgi:hypothetical protein
MGNEQWPIKNRGKIKSGFMQSAIRNPKSEIAGDLWAG